MAGLVAWLFAAGSARANPALLAEAQAETLFQRKLLLGLMAILLAVGVFYVYRQSRRKRSSGG
jgi:cytochrome c oxidase assembly factor CtaG